MKTENITVKGRDRIKPFYAPFVLSNPPRLSGHNTMVARCMFTIS